MRNFNFNLLGTVQTVIGKQDYQIKKWLSKSTNELGYDVDVYAEPENRQGSVQPIGRSKYESMGLDFSKIYIKILDVQPIDVIDREQNADQIIFDGYIYNVLPNLNWNTSGEWNSVICIRVGKHDGE